MSAKSHMKTGANPSPRLPNVGLKDHPSPRPSPLEGAREGRSGAEPRLDTGKHTSSDLRPPSPQSGEGLISSDGPIPADEVLLDAKQVGKRLKLSHRTVSEMANEGRLPAFRVGIYLRFFWPAVLAHLNSHCTVINRHQGK